MRLIQTWHHTSTLNGIVTAEDVFYTCQNTAFDIIHFATHGGPHGIELSGGEVFTAEDIAQVARLKETPELFFNACQTGRLASYAVRHGVRTAICAEIDISEAEAWKLPLAFYSARRNGHANDPVGAYMLADSGDGDYSLIPSPAWIRDLQRSAQPVTTVIPYFANGLTRKEAIIWGISLTIASGTLAAGLLMLTGRF